MHFDSHVSWKITSKILMKKWPSWRCHIFCARRPAPSCQIYQVQHFGSESFDRLLYSQRFGRIVA
ncbi:hypothetical protein BGLA2_350028 [Burkholderia gladioli]|nr:hypothetical protein BGLA2_350028 [Burkholderia gladioli]